MKRNQGNWPLSNALELGETDEVQQALVKHAEACFEALWPSRLRAPSPLHDLYLAIFDLIRYDMRNVRGRAAVRKTVLNRSYLREEIGDFDNFGNATNLAEHPHSFCVPGIVAALRDELVTEGCEGLVDEIDAWLSGEAGASTGMTP